MGTHRQIHPARLVLIHSSSSHRQVVIARCTDAVAYSKPCVEETKRLIDIETKQRGDLSSYCIGATVARLISRKKHFHTVRQCIMTQSSSSSSSLEDNIFELLQEAQQLATRPEQAVEAATKVCVDVILLFCCGRTHPLYRVVLLLIGIPLRFLACLSCLFLFLIRTSITKPCI